MRQKSVAPPANEGAALRLALQRGALVSFFVRAEEGAPCEAFAAALHLANDWLFLLVDSGVLQEVTAVRAGIGAALHLARKRLLAAVRAAVDNKVVAARKGGAANLASKWPFARVGAGVPLQVAAGVAGKGAAGGGARKAALRVGAGVLLKLGRVGSGEAAASNVA